MAKYIILVCMALLPLALGKSVLDTKHLLEKKFFSTSCKELDAECDGLPACCRETVCYWPHGYKPLEDGYCVECIDQSLYCQRDAQCCDQLVCQKEHPLHVNGVCDVRLPDGARCHEGDNCESDHCGKEWWEIFGVCGDEHDSSSSDDSSRSSHSSHSSHGSHGSHGGYGSHR